MTCTIAFDCGNAIYAELTHSHSNKLQLIRWTHRFGHSSSFQLEEIRCVVMHKHIEFRIFCLRVIALQVAVHLITRDAFLVLSSTSHISLTLLHLVSLTLLHLVVPQPELHLCSIEASLWLVLPSSTLWHELSGLCLGAQSALKPFCLIMVMYHVSLVSRGPLTSLSWSGTL